MSNPTFPARIPRAGAAGSPQVAGDQKMNRAIEGSVHSTHNGHQYPGSERPTERGGTPLIDLYQWEED